MRAPSLCVFLISLVTSFSSLSAQSTAENDADLKRQVAALREAVIQQTRQIDALTAEIERLGVALGQRRPSTVSATTSATPATDEAPMVNTTNPLATPMAAVTPTPDPNILQHTVVKGDNLTNIAKKYGTTVEVIQKLNNITDARKMQVGQILRIPTPSPSPSTPPPSH